MTDSEKQRDRFSAELEALQRIYPGWLLEMLDRKNVCEILDVLQRSKLDAAKILAYQADAFIYEAADFRALLEQTVLLPGFRADDYETGRRSLMDLFERLSAEKNENSTRIEAEATEKTERTKGMKYDDVLC